MVSILGFSKYAPQTGLIFFKTKKKLQIKLTFSFDRVVNKTGSPFNRDDNANRKNGFHGNRWVVLTLPKQRQITKKKDYHYFPMMLPSQ